MSKVIPLLLLSVISITATAQSPLYIEIDKLMKPYMNPAEPGGVVLVAKKGEVLYEKAFGLANVELNVPNTDSSVFYIGSNTKQFTATAILQLAEKGKLKLDDSIGKYIANCPYPVSSIRIEQFLSHTSGMGSKNETPAYRAIDRKGMTPLQLVNYFTTLPIDFPAGTKWQYNNANFYVLGYLVEKLSGMSYADYITSTIFKPAGMSRSYMDKEAAIVPNRTSGYLNFRLGVQNTRITTVESLYSSGGIQSTASDMLKWNRALNNGTLLKPESLKRLYTPQTLLTGQQTKYGMGFHLQEVKGSVAYRHGGLVEGFTSETLYLPGEDVYVVILLNEETSKIPIVPLARILAGIAIGKPYIYTEQPIDPKSVEKYVGVYERMQGEVINIQVYDGKLTFQRPMGAPYDLTYAGNDEFFLPKDLLRTAFTTDSAGNINSLRLSQADDALSTWNKTKRAALTLTKERLADGVLQQYVGVYVEGKDSIRITRDRSALFYQSTTSPKHMIVASSATRFVSVNEDFQVEFVKDTATKVESLIYVQGKKKKRYKKI
jgi:CubicO group peptidase (beta-lactamase class C family)